ncbi:hypothetical protein [Cellulomonas endometrii]|uniref:hypothetical protein n=1 Tax=Cellulomonas endometrii TaxID=3036301 RepID=UPI0024AD3686|nr:hypothetical protein [Cellulomonas endometrii]
MSDGLTISGGAGGVGARLQDLRSQAGLLDAAGDEVRGWTDDVARIALHPDITAAALLCPVEVAGVTVAVTDATVGRHGLLVVSTGLEATAVVLRASATTYAFVDATAQAVLERLHDAAGFTLGAALPFLAAGSGVALLGGGMALAAHPARWPAVLLAARNLDPAALQGQLMQGLYDNPWLLEGLTRMAPALIQGTTWSLGTLLGGPNGGLALPYVLSGGQWPTPSYEDAVAGLVNAGGLFGMFDDTGEVGVRRSDDLRWAEPPRCVEDILMQQAYLGLPATHGQIQIVDVPQADGSHAYVVQIPGTQPWSPVRGENPVDLTTNLRLMAGESTFMQAQVAEAMRRAGIESSDPVMLTGHSQGGITAAALASDPAFRERFDVRSVVTAGSPIARFDIPGDVSVLSLEHDNDAVPMLEGRDNPPHANWVTVERRLSEGSTLALDEDDPSSVVPTAPGPGSAHSVPTYAATGALVDRSQDPTVQRWRAQQDPFLTGAGTVTRWDVTTR